MKKVLVAVMALSLMAGVASCNKDDDEPKPIHDNECTEYAENLGEGLYQPKLHVSTVTENGANVSTFTWEGNTLKSMTQEGSNVTLAYTNEGRLKSGTYQGNTYSYIYNGNEVKSVRMTGLLGLMAHIDVIHKDGHISQLSYDSLNIMYITQLAGEYLNFGLKDSRKFSLGDFSMNETFVWEGDNVSKHNMEGITTIGVAPSEVNTIVNIEELVYAYLEANYPSIANNSTMSGLIDILIQTIVTDEREMLVDLNIVVEENYSYDTKRNYLQYFWPMGILPNNLSANNMTNMKQVVTMNATAHYELPGTLGALASIIGMSTLNIPFSKEISRTSDNYSYEYNHFNFPIKVKSDNGEMKINYK